MEKPLCFEKHWDPKAAECAGGYDPSFIESDSRTRKPCAFFRECGTQTTAKRMETARLIPATQLHRPEQTYRPAPTPMVQAPQPIAQQPAPMFYAPPSAPIPHPGSYQQAVPIGYQAQAYAPMPVNYNIPTYLAVPEERHSGESFWPVALRTVVRSAIKGAAHGVAAFVDGHKWK